MPVAPLANVTKQQRLLAHFRAQIACGALRVGDRVPPEVLLASQLGVNRNTVAKALSILASEGVLLRRRGGGTVVVRVPPPGPTDAGDAAGVDTGTLAITCALRTGDPNHLVNPQTLILTALESTLNALAPRLRIRCLNTWPGGRLDAGQLAALTAGGPRGVVHIANGGADEHTMANLDALRRAGVPHVVIAVDSDLPGCDLVGASQGAFGRGAAAHLLGLGHRRLLFVAPDLAAGWLEQRIEGFRQALADAGLDAGPDTIMRSGQRLDSDPDGGVLAGAQAGARIAAHGGITGVVAVNDAYAAGLVTALRERGVAVPERISVVGTDDAYSFRDLDLTTMRPPFARIGEAAARMILDRMRADAPRDRTEIWHLFPTLVERATSAAPAPS
ncbi:MAG: substrate-binding domain-containing protein [Planctomycetes bacterium]|nr:substrate-binding domain-containing protein [Planctomycetota bacterium]